MLSCIRFVKAELENLPHAHATLDIKPKLLQLLTLPWSIHPRNDANHGVEENNLLV